MKAIWDGKIIAESDETIEIENNQYFPPDSVKKEFLKKSGNTYTCPWKGLCYYYDVTVDGKTAKDGAWSYPVPKEGSVEMVGKDFANYFAFWHGVEIKE